ncbi:MAG: hypothetical protein ACJ8G7_16750 [Rhizobacter sp.]
MTFGLRSHVQRAKQITRIPPRPAGVGLSSDGRITTYARISTMIGQRQVLVPLLAVLLTACASQQKTSSSATDPVVAAAPAASSPYGPARIVKSKDGRFDGEVIGTPGAKFSKLKIGMTMAEVTALIGGPDNIGRHETGKRWIPFYFGNDAQRMEALYKGEGCLTYTGGNAFGGGESELIRITATPRTDCIE